MNTAPSPTPGLLERRLLPATNPDTDDRRCAWDELLAAGLHQSLVRFVSSHNYTLTPTEDIVQEVLRCAYQKTEQGKYKPGSPSGIIAWLVRIAVFKIKEAARKRTHGSLDEFEELLPDLRAERHNAEHQATWALLNAALGTLQERDRTIVVLSVFYDFSSAEIARKLDMRADLVRKHKSLALRDLRERLAADLPERARRAA